MKPERNINLPDWLERLPTEELLNVLTAGVAVFDGAGRIVFWNDAAEEITGFERGEALGRTPEFLEGIGCEGFNKLTNALQSKAKVPGEMSGMRCRVLVKNGRVARLFGNGRIVSGPRGAKLGAVASFLDLTQVEVAEARAVQLEEDLKAERGFGKLIGASPAMKRHFRQIQQAAATDVTVLITGESGTGKELAARAIHDSSARASQPFVAVHCSALPESLLESELFGHVKGSFTGATRDSTGRFELASGGTLFLDEIGELSPLIQVKLLRALEQREIERVGEGRPRPVDVRVVAATHRDLREMVATGRMREDFYFRVRVFPLEVPPLRARREDIAALAMHLLGETAERTGKTFGGFTPEAMDRLTHAAWPGNVRELRNAIEYACVVAEGRRIDAADLPPDLEPAVVAAGPFDSAQGKRPDSPTLAGTPRTTTPTRLDPEEIERVIAECGGRVGEAAERLGVSRVTLWRRRRRQHT